MMTITNTGLARPVVYLGQGSDGRSDIGTTEGTGRSRIATSIEDDKSSKQREG